ncbi:Multiprotein-bridging factor 1 [Neolecta irregularis DAH-3]|uniref:Multiprotein-bridging factor 1 n=1 Tax=Neolecta irregularis (strain DAH-3) TaxID=1198029 RepID=A0A1U7LTI0_NEOID|nr:Multiprotein-bridging factor 1 [Neolecta irregularis DAH-3]|eukprot:OLL25852.1 Multiprotein-bridging factor 1 [Neolecta irregularis DAH-3]
MIDETPVIIGKRAQNGRTAVAKSAAEINAAMRSGSVVGTEKKYDARTNKAHKDTEGQKMAKVDRENEIRPPEKVSSQIGKFMAQQRGVKGWTQKDLATRVSEKPSVINDYEGGRAIPNQIVLGKLERVLEIKLRGKDIGEQLFKKK